MKKLFSNIAAAYLRWNMKRQFVRFQKEAAEIVARIKEQYPGCEGAMNAWPTTGASGNGNAATGQYIANGTWATTLLWGTNNIMGGSTPTGFLTILDVKFRTLAEKIPMPNGDGLTAGLVQLIDGVVMDLEVRDDTTQVTTGLTVGQRVYILDNGGLVPGGARNAQYSGIITEHDWNTAPKTAAGRRLAVDKYLLIT
jgi:hypothetical protein